jgi:hypothetical protein
LLHPVDGMRDGAVSHISAKPLRAGEEDVARDPSTSSFAANPEKRQ